MIATYADLQAAIAGWLNRGDLTAVIPDFVTLCESSLKRVIRTKHLTASTATVLAGMADLPVPPGTVEINSLFITSPLDRGGALNPLPPEQLADKRREYQVSGRPLYYSVIGNTILLTPTPDVDHTFGLVIEGPFLPLSLGNPVNWLLQDYPDVYLYGSLVHSAPYLKDDERIALWQSAFSKALAELEEAQTRWEYPTTPARPVPGGGYGRPVGRLY